MTTTSPDHNDDASPIVWIPLGSALERIVPHCDHADGMKRLMTLLRTATVRTRATVVEEQVADSDVEFSRDAPIARSTWFADFQHELVDAPSGVLELRGTVPDSNTPCILRFHGLELVEDDLAGLLGPAQPRSYRSNAGRLPGKFWPVFAEELAMQAHDGELDDQNMSVAAAIKRIFDAMTARGHEVPSENAVRHTVGQVLGRIRANE